MGRRVIKSFQGLCSNSAIRTGRSGPQLSLCRGDYKDSNIIDFFFFLLEKEAEGGGISPCISLNHMVFSSVLPQGFFSCSLKCLPHCIACLLLQFKFFPFIFTLYLKLWAGHMKEQQKPKTTDFQFILPATLSSITDLKEHELHLQKSEDVSFVIEISLPEN